MQVLDLRIASAIELIWFHPISRHKEVGRKMWRGRVFKDRLRGTCVWILNEILSGVFDVASQMNYHKYNLNPLSMAPLPKII